MKNSRGRPTAEIASLTWANAAIRIIKYYALLMLTVLAISYAAYLLEGHTPSNLSSLSRMQDTSAFSKVFVSPIFETVIMYWCWLGTRRLSSSATRQSALFMAIIVALSWLTHGANGGAIVPSIMFLFSTVFIIRSTYIYIWTIAASFTAAATLHALFNLPSAILHG